MNTSERFMSKVCMCFPETGCWHWHGVKSASAYGRFSVVMDGARRWRGAHRFAYELIRGPIPEGLVLDHLCRRRDCVNPWHLEPVTNWENLLRGEGLAAQNSRKTHCESGHEFAPENTTRTAGGLSSLPRVFPGSADGPAVSTTQGRPPGSSR